ncbi:MAG: hypothetical protein ACR2G3_03815 [Solirubrobacterales bacterium]
MPGLRGTRKGEAEVRLLPERREAAPARGPARSLQEADLELPAELLDELWRPEYLERLAHAYWRYLRRISLGLLRVIYEPTARSIVLVGRPLVLLRFRAPEYVTPPGMGQVTWPIERGVLVTPEGRGRGYLRIKVRRLEGAREGRAVVRVSSEVANFYPLLRFGGPLARLGARFYSATQLRIHVWVTHGFLRSLARLDLPPSPVGALAARPQAGEEDGPRA